MLRRLPLRARLALLVAVAVAVGVAGVATVAWFATKDRLYSQVDKSIESSRPPVIKMLGSTPPGDPCQPDPQPGSSPFESQPRPQTDAQILKPDNTTCPILGSAEIKTTPADLAVASGALDSPYWRYGTAADGSRVRVEVTYDLQHNWALLKSQPLTAIDDSLTSLAWLLLIVAGFGIAGAATAGLLVARAALSPVDRLTAAVKHIARTEDLSVRIPVNGDDEIASLSRSFNAMTAALSKSRDEQKRLIDDASHELRTPLTSLRTTIDLLIRSDESGRPLPEGTRSALLTGARTQMRELSILIADLLELSRPEQAKNSTSAMAPVDFRDVAQHAVERVRPRGMAKEEPVHIDAELSPWFTHGDDAALERAIVNLLDNAVKFSPPGGTVDVTLKDGVLTVRDRGPGIPFDELPHVFERFWRSPSARALPGSGLGLSIASRVVRESGGEVSLAAARDGGGGTVARIALPGSARRESHQGTDSHGSFIEGS